LYFFLLVLQLPSLLIQPDAADLMLTSKLMLACYLRLRIMQ